MAEDGTLAVARVEEQTEEPSKQELQRRLDEARDSISHTVTEIKETVANQVQAVKETLDWREQFKKRPVIWSAGAMGAGFLVGYGVAAMIKGNGKDEEFVSAIGGYEEEPVSQRSYAAQPVLQGSSTAAGFTAKGDNGRPGLLQRLTSTTAYERVKSEAGNVGDALVQELSKTAKQVVLPALMTSLRNFLGGHLPNAPKNRSTDYTESV